MQIFSEKFEDSITISKSLYQCFESKARNTNYFDEDKINDLIYYISDLYTQKGSQFRGKMTKAELLEKIVILLNYIEIDEILMLKAHELLNILEDESTSYATFREFYA